jgi:hypothetical protein
MATSAAFASSLARRAIGRKVEIGGALAYDALASPQSPARFPVRALPFELPGGCEINGVSLRDSAQQVGCGTSGEGIRCDGIALPLNLVP